MKLVNVLMNLRPPIGLTSAIHAERGDAEARSGVASVADILRLQASASGSFQELLDRSRAELKRLEMAQRNCKSDAAHWSYQGSISFWKCAIDLQEAAALVGPDNLPEVQIPDGAGVLIDLCAQMERFGKEVLEQAKLQAIRTDPDVKVLGVGPSGVDLSQPAEPGTARRISMIKLSDLERLSAPMLALLNSLREGESPDIILGVLMVVCGQIAAQSGVIIRGDAPVESQLAPLWFGYGEAMAVAANAAGKH